MTNQIRIGDTWFDEDKTPSPSDLAEERHDDEHPNPRQFADECEWCENLLDQRED